MKYKIGDQATSVIFTEKVHSVEERRKLSSDPWAMQEVNIVVPDWMVIDAAREIRKRRPYAFPEF